MSKQIMTSTDAGTTWRLLPGGTGALDKSAGAIEDTVFGQSYQSHEAGLISWAVHGQALQKGQAGYKATVKQQGASTVMTGEAMTLVSGKRYKVTNVAHSIWDRSLTVTVKDNAVAVSVANIKTVDYLFGQVEFVSTYTPSGAITVDGKYFPTVALGHAQSFSLKQTANALNVTDFGTAQANGGYVANDYGLKIVSLDLSDIYALADGFEAAMLARSEYIIEICPDGLGYSGAGSLCRGFYRLTTDNQSGNVGALEIDALTFELNVPVKPSNIELPFRWVHGASTLLSQSVIDTLNAWTNNTNIQVAYSAFGVEGDTGDSIVTEATMSSGMDAMVDFTCVFTGDGVLTPYATPKVPQ